MHVYIECGKHTTCSLLALSGVLLCVLCGATQAECTDVEWCRNEYYEPHREYYRCAWGITEVPDDIPAQALKVYLFDNVIKTIPPKVFKHLSECTRLQLEKNLFTTINKTAFVGMESLELLWLRENQISIIEPQTFAPVKELSKLDLHDNRLSAVKVGMFAGLFFLKHLNLSTNKISAIDEGSFDDLYSLKEVRLGGNKLKQLSPDLFINIIRPLTMFLNNTECSTCNSFICKPSLCWLKNEEQHGTVLWPDDDALPKCKSQSWKDFECKDPGMIFITNDLAA